MATSIPAASATAFRSRLTDMFRAFGGQAEAAPRPSDPVSFEPFSFDPVSSDPIGADCFDDDDAEPAIAGEDLSTARDRFCLANYPLGVTG